MIQAVIFDMGGVVLNAKIENAYEILAKKLSIDKTQFDIAKNKYIKDAQKGKLSADELLRIISSELKIDQTTLRKSWEEAYSEVMAIDNDVLNIAIDLKKKGYAVALITNTIEIHSELNKKRGVYSKFSPVILSSEVGLLKPEEEIYKLMLKKLKLFAEECIFIDDREEHLAPAIKLGMHPILFKNPQQLNEELNAILNDKS